MSVRGQLKDAIEEMKMRLGDMRRVKVKQDIDFIIIIIFLILNYQVEEV